MKGTVHKCIEKLVVEKFGEKKWQECLKAAGFDEDHVFMLNDDVDEGQTMLLITKAPEVLGITLEQVIGAFAQYWVHVYAPMVYPAYFLTATSAKEFMEKLDELHVHVTQTIPNAKPPRFTYKKIGEGAFSMQYNSPRGLVDLFIAMAKEIGVYYKSEVSISKKEDNIVEFSFQ